MRVTGSIFTSLAFCLLTLLVSVASVAQTVTYSDPASGNKGSSTIRGRVIYDDTEKPVRRVRVLLVGNTSGPLPPRIAVTDGHGEFTLKNVGAGSYRLVVDFGGHVNGYPREDGKSGTPVTVAESSSAEVRLRATRAASISGKVTYPDGEPVIGAQINALLKEGKNWTHPSVSPLGATTDDRGVFRIYPLAAGEYVVSVSERGLAIEERDGRVMQTMENKSITPYFYQDASGLKNATIIQVETGRETSNINFTLNERATYVVSGSVTVNDKPLTGVSLRLNSRDEGRGGATLAEAWGESTHANKDGRWSFKSVPDGVYWVELDFISSEGFRTRNKYLSNREEITVGGADVSGVVLNLTEAGQISGTVVVEGGKKLPEFVSMTSQVVKAGTQGAYHSNQSMELDPKGTFLIEGIAPGENTLSLTTDEDYFVKSITWNSRDLLRQTIRVDGGRETKGVVIVLSDAVGILTGRVVSADGRKPLPGIYYVLVPADEMRWENRQGWKSGNTDEAGDFDVSGAPGDYLFLAFPNGIGGLKSLEDLKALLPRATRVSLKTTPQNEVEIVAPAN